jgi:hypothetical protein
MQVQGILFLILSLAVSAHQPHRSDSSHRHVQAWEGNEEGPRRGPARIPSRSQTLFVDPDVISDMAADNEKEIQAAKDVAAKGTARGAALLEWDR